MFARLASIGLSLTVIAGCAAPPPLQPPGLDHPADPQAAEAPLPPASTTLAIDANPVQPVPRPDESAVPRSSGENAGHAKPGTGSMSGMKGMGDMQGMSPASPATMPAQDGGGR